MEAIKLVLNHFVLIEKKTHTYLYTGLESPEIYIYEVDIKQ